MEDSNLWAISDVSKFLGVSEKTLRAWDKKGTLVAEKTEGGHRRYKPDDVRDFLRQGKVEEQPKTIADEFVESDLRIQTDTLAKDIAFWERKGYLDKDLGKYDKSVLATLLSNQMSHSCNKFCAGNGLDEEATLNLFVSYWGKITSRKFVHFGAMSGPTGLHYYQRPHKATILIDSGVISSKTKKFSTRLVIPRDPDKNAVTYLHPETLEPFEKQISNPFSHITQNRDWLTEWNAGNIANEIDDEVVSDLWGIAEQVEKPVADAVLHNPDANFLVANTLGLRLLGEAFSHDFGPLEEGLSTKSLGKIQEFEVYYNRSVNGILVGKKAENYIAAPYSYYTYVPVIQTPTTLDEKGLLVSGFISRYDKYVVPHIHDKNPFVKIVI